MKILSVNVTKGGCGKSTTCQALAELFGKTKRVLCIDLDIQHNLTIVSGIDIMECQEHNIYSLLNGTSTLEQCIYKSKYYDIIPSSMNLSRADSEFNKVGREFLLKELLEKVEGYDLVIIDNPPAINLANTWALTCCDYVLIPSEGSYLSYLGINQLLDFIESIRKYSNANLSILGFLLTKFSMRQNVHQMIFNNLEQLAQDVGTQVFPVHIKETVKIKEAQALTEPLLDYCRNCSAMLNYKELYELIMPLLTE